MMLPTPKKSKPKKTKQSPKPKSRKKEDRAESHYTQGSQKLVLKIPKHCLVCNEKFETKQQLDRHVKEVCTTEKFSCDKCEKSFKTEAQVNNENNEYLKTMEKILRIYYWYKYGRLLVYHNFTETGNIIQAIYRYSVQY